MSIPLDGNNPNVPSIEEARLGIQTFAMYHYQSLLDAGFNEKYSKEQTANLLESQYNLFQGTAGLDPKSIGPIKQRISKLLVSVKTLASSNTEARAIYNELLSIEKYLGR